MDLVIRVTEIKGNCPVYEVGDTFYLKEGYRLESDKPLCMHSLASLMPHYNALRISPPSQWGLAGKDNPEKAYVQCLDPVGQTGGGTAVFEISRRGEKKAGVID
ncbi:MAG: TIGR04076 family protein [Gemmatimonadota bacterium]|nr:TIGR04076 family protein [Gemmatimonadota bacterium]